MSENKVISLLELQQKIQQKIKDSFSETVWITAEINEFTEHRNGHAYLDLIQKSEGSDQIIAKTRAMIWATTYRMLKPYFETSTGRNLEAGLKIMVSVAVGFHEVFGFSLTITDIDPVFTIGDLENQRRQTIKRLEEEGVIDLNKEFDLPDVLKTIAVISSENAAGYGDFMNQLNKNTWDLAFHTHLFPAIMQGNTAEKSIVAALEKIYEYDDVFDAVVIIRGGGARSDLSVFDNYWLAANIAQFPMPVLTGIGHDRDNSVCDLVAHTALKTPTAVAEFLINHNSEAFSYVVNLENEAIRLIRDALGFEKKRLDSIFDHFFPKVNQALNRKRVELEKYSTSLHHFTYTQLNLSEQKLNYLTEKTIYASKESLKYNNFQILNVTREFQKKVAEKLDNQHRKLLNFETRNDLLNPKNILKRGYSITSQNGRVIKSIDEINKNETIYTQLYNGGLESKIQND